MDILYCSHDANSIHAEFLQLLCNCCKNVGIRSRSAVTVFCELWHKLFLENNVRFQETYFNYFMENANKKLSFFANKCVHIHHGVNQLYNQRQHS